MISFKSTLLEGLEVAFIVITLGANQGATAIAAAGAVVALVVVVIIGALVRHPLSRVPENTLKFAVGVMLTSFGTFWAGEGVGIDWPGAEALAGGADRAHGRLVAAFHAAARAAAAGGDGVRGLVRGIVDFVVGDDIWIAVAVVLLLGGAGARSSARSRRLVALPVGVPVALWVSLSARGRGEPSR